MSEDKKRVVILDLDELRMLQLLLNDRIAYWSRKRIATPQATFHINEYGPVMVKLSKAEKIQPSAFAEFASELRMRMCVCELPPGEPVLTTFDKCVAKTLADISPEGQVGASYRAELLKEIPV